MKIRTGLGKSEIFELFEEKISRLAIQERGDEWVIIGKFVIISMMDGMLDVFICNPSNIREGLGVRKVNNIVSKLEKHCVEGSLVKLNGETYLNVSDVNVILSDLALLGIRKKRFMSEKVLAETRERMAKINEGRA